MRYASLNKKVVGLLSSFFLSSPSSSSASASFADPVLNKVSNAVIFACWGVLGLLAWRAQLQLGRSRTLPATIHARAEY